MSHRLITECPACTTRFQVTQGQLKIANGKVRCGSCLEVFNAEVYRCDDLPDHTEAVLRELHEEEQEQQQIRDSKSDPLFDDIEVPEFTVPDFSGTTPDKRYIDPDADEKLAELLNDQLNTDDTEDELEQPIQDLLNETFSQQASYEMDLVQDHQAEPEPVPLVDDLPSLTPHNKDKNIEKNKEKGTEKETPPETRIKSDSETAIEKTASTEANVKEQLDQEPEPSPEAVIASQPFPHYQAEPIYIKTTKPKPGHPIFWSVSVLIAVLAIAAQYLWFNRQHLNSYPELAPIYSLACQHLPCNLLPAVRLDKITTNSLVITEHKEFQGALTVNLLLENHADHRQPYPAVLLTFADRSGEMISERLLQPEEYLSQTETEIQKMPASRVVQIHFDILDPGRRAVSYEAKLMIPSAQPLPVN